jgi:hypothetical protein
MAAKTTALDRIETADRFEETDAGNGSPPAGAPTEPRVGTTIDVDDSRAIAGYANFCRVSSTPEELILDLGLNPRPMDPQLSRVDVSQRIIMNHYTAKRLLAALTVALQRHEGAFGVLETDIRKRVRVSQ